MTGSGGEGRSPTVRDPAIFDHLRPRTADAPARTGAPGPGDTSDLTNGSGDSTAPARTGGPVDAGVYRVVGSAEDSVTLLKVGDADGHRVTTGNVVTVDRNELGGFELAANPDHDRSAIARFVGVLDGLAWQLRTFGAALSARPVAATGAILLFAGGIAGDRVFAGFETGWTLVTFAGAFALAYLGTRGG